MFNSFTISGLIKYDDTLVNSDYKLINLTKDYKNIPKTSVDNYYNINSMNLDTKFDNEDLVCIEFKTTIDGNEYFNRIYTIVDFENNVINISSKLLSNWDYKTTITTTKKKAGSYSLLLNTTLYQKFYIEVYYKYKEFTIVDRFFIDKQTLDINFNYNGEYKIRAYAISNERLLSYDETILQVNDITNSKSNRRYIEWE